MKLEQLEKGQQVLSKSKKVVDFYNHLLRELNHHKLNLPTYPDDFNCCATMERLIGYVEVEKQLAMEKAEKMLEAI